MKFLFLSAILTSLLFGDEIARVDSIVKDISELRQKYELCQDELDKIITVAKQCEVNEIELKVRYQEILFLQKEKDKALKYLRSENKKLTQENEKITALTKEILKLKDSLKAPLPKACKKEDSFPQLKMKEGYEHLQGEDKI